VTRFLRVYAWFRWRSLSGSFRFGRDRGGLGHVAGIAEVLLRALAAMVVVGFAIGLGMLAFLAGGRLSSVADDGVIALMRLMGAGLVFVGVAIPGGRATEESGGARTRMRLLPIGSRQLHAAEVLSGLVEPWMVVSAPAILLFTVGPARHHGLLTGAIAFVSGLLLIASVLLLGMIASRTVQAVLRDRRRIETAAIILMLLVVTLSLLPSLAPDELQLRDWSRDGSAVIAMVVDWVGPLLPSEHWSAALAAANSGRPAAAGRPLAIQLAFVLTAYWLSFRLWRRVMETPEAAGPGQSGGRSTSFARPPGVPATVAAVAHAQVRVYLRTVRGKLAVAISPIWMAAVALLLRDRVMARLPDDARTTAAVVLALAGASLAIMGLLPLIANQFVVDRGGLSRQFLSPLSDRAIVAGKALGGAFLALISVTSLIVAIALVIPAPVMAWLGAVVGAMAGYVLQAPIVAFLSVVLAKPADLTNLGTRGNAHVVASLLGGAVAGLSVAPSMLLALVTLMAAGRPSLFLSASLGWLLVTVLASRHLLMAVAAMVTGRREALIDLASRG